MLTFMLFLSTVTFCIFLLWRHCSMLSSPTVPQVPNIPGLIWTFTTSNLNDIFKLIISLGEFTNDSGGVSKIPLGPVVFYNVSSPEYANIILQECLEKSFVYDLIKPYVGSQLVAANVTTWKCNKRFINLAMKQSVFDSYNYIFNKYSSRLVEMLAAELNKDMDFSNIITRSILEMVSETTMGMTLDGENLITDEYANAVDMQLNVMVDRVRSPWLLLDPLFNLSKLKKVQNEALKIIFRLSDKMVHLIKEKHLKNLHYNELQKENDMKSFLEIIIKNSVTKDNEFFTNVDLRNIVDNIMLASFDTSTSQILYALICIGHYPDIQEALYEELNRVIIPKGRVITKDDLSKLTYLEAIIKETLRLYPVGPVVARRTTNDVKLENHIIPAGCQVVLHVWSLNRNKLHWGADAEEFKPERWLNPSSIPSHPSAFATFLSGRRYCIGKSYAMTMMKIILAHVVQEYKVSADLSKLELEMAVLLKPSAGHTFELQRRN